MPAFTPRMLRGALAPMPPDDQLNVWPPDGTGPLVITQAEDGDLYLDVPPPPGEIFDVTINGQQFYLEIPSREETNDQAASNLITAVVTTPPPQPRGVVLLIMDDTGSRLLMQTNWDHAVKADMYYVPWTFLPEFDETFLDAADRGLHETGIDADAHWWHVGAWQHHSTQLHVYRTQLTNPVFDPPHFAPPQWIPVVDLPGMVASGRVYDTISAFVALIAATTPPPARPISAS